MTSATSFEDGRSKREAWRELIAHTFDHWRLATAGLVGAAYRGDCPDYSPFIAQIVADVRAKHDIEGGDIKKHVTAILDQSEDLGMLRNRGFMLNEVMMFDDIDGPVVNYQDVVAFGEIAFSPNPPRDDLGDSP